MRPIKFRAYDRLMKQMVNVKTLDFSPQGAECAVDYSDINGDIDGEWDLMEYTGLKDSEDVEIYEDDLVKIIATDGDSFIAPVKYYADNDYPAFDIDERYVPDSWFFAANILSTVIGDDSKIFVIGNIHENPELLEADI